MSLIASHSVLVNQGIIVFWLITKLLPLAESQSVPHKKSLDLGLRATTSLFVWIVLL